MNSLFAILAQVKTIDPDVPRLQDAASGTTWMIAAVLVAGILLIAFKTSKRSHTN